MSIKIKTTQKPELIEPQEETIDNKLEILTFLAKVKGRIKKDITEDFILAKLSEKDKIAIINMTSNAYYMYKITTIIAEKSTKYEWNNNKKEWTIRTLTKEEKESINNIAKAIFDSIMTPIYMTVLLNRNVEKNHLVRIIAGANQEIEEEGTPKEESLLEQAKKMVKPKKKPEDEE